MAIVSSFKIRYTYSKEGDEHELCQENHPQRYVKGYH